MLVLSRHRDEVVRIGDEISITVIEIRGDKVRLGIDAPAGVAVHRQEVYEALKRIGQDFIRRPKPHPDRPDPLCRWRSDRVAAVPQSGA